MVKDAVEYTKNVIERIWQSHENKARLEDQADELWAKHRKEILAADDLVEYLDCESPELIAYLLRQKMRDEAPPAIKQTKKGMWA